MVQKAKRVYWYKIQTGLLNKANHDNNEPWKSIGKVGIGSKKNIPMEVVLDNDSVSYHQNDVLEKWKSCFSRLYDSVKITTELSSKYIN